MTVEARVNCRNCGDTRIPVSRITINPETATWTWRCDRCEHTWTAQAGCHRVIDLLANTGALLPLTDDDITPDAIDQLAARLLA